MARLIDADKLESGEVIIPTENGGYEYVEVFYKDDVDNAPTVDAEPVKHGHWIMKPNGYGTCSNCKACSLDIMGGVDSNFCPNCGAKMDEVEDDKG